MSDELEQAVSFINDQLQPSKRKSGRRVGFSFLGKTLTIVDSATKFVLRGPDNNELASTKSTIRSALEKFREQQASCENEEEDGGNDDEGDSGGAVLGEASDDEEVRFIPYTKPYMELLYCLSALRRELFTHHHW